MDLGGSASGSQDGGLKLFSYYQRVIDRWKDCAILYTIYTELQDLNPEESKEVRQGYEKNRGYKKLAGAKSRKKLEQEDKHKKK